MISRTTTAALLGTALAAATIVVASPAMAGDVPAPAHSQVGNWKTSTNGIPQTLTFTKDGKVYGDSGCNRFTGGYTVKGDAITIGPLASTLMACPDPQMKAEATFLGKLQKSNHWKADSAKLRLYHGSTLTLKLTSA